MDFCDCTKDELYAMYRSVEAEMFAVQEIDSESEMVAIYEDQLCDIQDELDRRAGL